MSTPASQSPISADSVVYFITGASRGIGYALTEKLAARSNTIIYAGARDPSKADKLQQLAKQHSNVRVVQLSVESDADHQAAVKRVEAEAGRVDVLVANAGISKVEAYQRVEAMSVDHLRENFEVNTVGPVRLFTSFFPLLNRSAAPKFVVVSSGAGSISYQSSLPTFYGANYGSSKAAINFITQRVHVEHPRIVAFPLNPGWTDTDMGNAGAKANGLKEPPVKLADSISGITKLLDEAQRDTHSGKLWDAPTGQVIGW